MSDDGPFTRAERHLAELSDEIRLAATFDAMHERALAAVEQMGREMREGFIEPATVEDWIDRAVATAECFDSAEHGAIMRDVGDELARLFEPANGAQPNRRHGNGSGQEPQAIGHQFFGKSSAEFVRDFVPPDYLIDGIMQQRFLYAITGRTGSGKTAVVFVDRRMRRARTQHR